MNDYILVEKEALRNITELVSGLDLQVKQLSELLRKMRMKALEGGNNGKN